MKADLNTLVTTAIQNHINKQQPFSARDITLDLRDKITSGAYELDNTPWEDVNGVNTQRVEHDDVRALVQTYFASGTVQGYGLLQSTPGISYRVYGPITDNSTPASAPSTTPFPASPWTAPAATDAAPPKTTYKLSSRTIQHPFLLRPDGTKIVLRLPQNLTQGEANRLAAAIRTLPFPTE